MTVTKIKGSKHEKDKIILFNGHAPTFLEILEVILQHCNNEDNIYPPSKGFKGGAMLQEFYIKFIGERRMPNDDELRILKLGKYRPKERTKIEM